MLPETLSSYLYVQIEDYDSLLHTYRDCLRSCLTNASLISFRVMLICSSGCQRAIWHFLAEQEEMCGTPNVYNSQSTAYIPLIRGYNCRPTLPWQSLSSNVIALPIVNRHWSFSTIKTEHLPSRSWSLTHPSKSDGHRFRLSSSRSHELSLRHRSIREPCFKMTIS